MSTITIKNLPPAIHRSLKSRASAHGRSLNKEIIATLEGTLHGSRLDGVAIGRHACMVREAMGVYLTQKDLAAFKDTGRK